MAAKKVAKKSHDTQQLEKRPKTVFGLDVREVGTAIATAVVAELSQLALKQITKSLEGDTVAQTQSSVNDMADSAETAAKNPVKTVANAAKDAVDNVKPAVSEAVSGTNGAANSVMNAAASGKGFSQDTAQLIEDTVRQAVMAVSNRFETTKQHVSGTAADTASAVKTKVKELKTDASDKKKAKKSKKKKNHKK